MTAKHCCAILCLLKQNIVTKGAISILISKKDLLLQTGISYGQLYRWKREKLIPEDWFLKQPSFTGQETFFPKQKILARIAAIQSLKDKYSLEELSKILSPEVSQRSFTINDLSIITEITPRLIPAFVNAFGKDTFSYIEVLLLVALSELNRRQELQLGQLICLAKGISSYCDQIKSTGFVFVLFDHDNDYYASLYQEQAQVFLDSRFRVIEQIRLTDLSSQMKLKYRKSFNFKFDEEEGEEPEGELSAVASLAR